MPTPVKPPALTRKSRIRVISPASPIEPDAFEKGCAELRRLGYEVTHRPFALERDGYFAGSATLRQNDLAFALQDPAPTAIVCSRGGYGSSYLLPEINTDLIVHQHALIGFSDITALQIFLWQKLGWITFYGPMLAAGFAAGPGQPTGYDESSFKQALTNTSSGWQLPLDAEPLGPSTTGDAEGVLLGGCLTLLRSTIGTPWELDTRGAILLLEDRGMKPFQVDRALLHLLQAGKFQYVRAILLGEFPECDPPVPGSPTVREVARRILAPLGIPIIFGAPVGHTPRPLLTLPLGVRARLVASSSPVLDILEPAVRPPKG